MITKAGSIGTFVDWDRVRKATEKPRTFMVQDKEGHTFFKMYKPSEAPALMAKKGYVGFPVNRMER